MRIGGARMELNLPANLSECEAIAWNEKIAAADGVKILSNGNVEFGEETKLAFKQYLPEISDGFLASEIDKVTQAMLELRERLTTEKPEPLKTYNA